MLSQFNRKDEFKSYLEQTCRLSARTIKAYVSAVQTMAEQMFPQVDLFGRSELNVIMSAIGQWKETLEFKQRDCHARFSAPLKHYVSFLRQVEPNRAGFRLICVYVEKYAVFKNQCFNFCSDYVVRLKGNSRKEIKFEVDYNPLLTADFFSVVARDGGCVSSVSAFIGENATGKTSFARLFNAIACGYIDAKAQPKVVVILENDGAFNALTTFEEPKSIKFVVGPKCNDARMVQCRLNSARVCRQTKSGGSLPFKFFYYSPFYTTGQSVGNEGDSVADISTTQLLRRPPGNLELLVSRDHVQASSIFEAEETRRVLEFISEYRRLRYKNTAKQKLMSFDMPCPRWIEINLYDDQVRHAIQELTDYVDNVREQESGRQIQVYSRMKSTSDELRDEAGDFLRMLIPVFKNRQELGKTSLIVHWFIGYSACYLSECGILNPSFSLSKMGDWYGRKLRDFICRELADANGNNELMESKIFGFLQTNAKTDDYSWGAANGDNDNLRARETLVVFRELQKLQRMHATRKTGDGLLCSFRSLYCLRMLIKLIQAHAKSKVFSPYLRFGLVPSMSSGEMAFMSMFARFYELVRSKTTSGDAVVVFLDEAETTLHPAWQRRLVDNLIRFFEIFIPNRRYQLLFASHSPILLSDLPAGNCCFIGKNESNPNFSMVRSDVLDETAGFTNTFAANIQDLYALPFFLNKGTIGQFALDKIKSKRSADLIPLVGNPILRAVLKGVWKGDL